MRGQRRSELIVQELVESIRAHLCDERIARAKRGLRKEAGRVSRRRRSARQGRRRGWYRRDLCTAGEIEETLNLTGRILRCVQVEVGAARFDHRHNVSDGERPDWNEDPDITSVRLWRRLIQVEQDRAVR